MNKFPLNKVSLTWGLKFTNFETVISTHFQHLAEKCDFKISTPSRFGNFRQCDTKATVTPADDDETMWNFSLCWWNSSPIWRKIFCLCHSAESLILSSKDIFEFTGWSWWRNCLLVIDDLLVTVVCHTSFWRRRMRILIRGKHSLHKSLQAWQIKMHVGSKEKERIRNEGLDSLIFKKSFLYTHQMLRGFLKFEKKTVFLEP